MTIFDVYGISDWPENYGERFLIFSKKPFDSEEQAICAARNAYNPTLVVECEVNNND